MKIGPEYCVMMARYNTWQNRQVFDLLRDVDPAELTRDRGAFFGSILGTLSHLLWGDHIWMSRFDGGTAPEVPGDKSTTLVPTLGAWEAERVCMDGRIRLWADALDNSDLQGDLVWYSGVADRDMSKPMAFCVVHMFNHQTHHRGQVHAMMTAAGLAAPVSDLIFMPEEVA
ncbi:DinB family protein [Sedimentitalea todarodis]|uniref:DinB family protein n=1 Tax=Sedimentitalea todarodis TaxID=1631240 RepID=A0ABU3VCE4_9RHOB|nr:DinB family protein [Sedimentitalea todarodis]MDU9003843.1 DinB family protein [Sedimentitalea todarodis]